MNTLVTQTEQLYFNYGNESSEHGFINCICQCLRTVWYISKPLVFYFVLEPFFFYNSTTLILSEFYSALSVNKTTKCQKKNNNNKKKGEEDNPIQFSFWN